MVIDCAVTAPVVPAGPTALAHLPTARSDADADVRSVKAVEDVKVTTTLAVPFVVRLVSVTVAVDPLTAVTGPDAAANWPAARPGNAPPAGRGVDPPGDPPPRLAPLPDPTRPKPWAHEPEEGWEMETDVAVTGPPNAGVVDDDGEVGLPRAEMHEPTVTSETAAVTVWSKLVVGV